MIGTVVRSQIPMIMTFDSEDAEFIVESLAAALEHSYKIIDFFDIKDGYGEE